MSNFEQLQTIMATVLKLPPDAISEQTTMEGLENWDSLGHVQIMVAVEQAFDLYLDVEDFAELVSVGAILRYLDSAQAG